MESRYNELRKRLLETVNKIRSDGHDEFVTVHLSPEDYDVLRFEGMLMEYPTGEITFVGWRVVPKMCMESGRITATFGAKTDTGVQTSEHSRKWNDEKPQPTFKDICHELMTTYAMKNADYGDSFGRTFEEYGIVSAVVRIADKYNRISELTKKDNLVDESIEDTLLDLAGYCIMTVMELRKK